MTTNKSQHSSWDTAAEMQEHIKDVWLCFPIQFYLCKQKAKVNINFHLSDVTEYK